MSYLQVGVADKQDLQLIELMQLSTEIRFKTDEDGVTDPEVEEYRSIFRVIVTQIYEDISAVVEVQTALFSESTIKGSFNGTTATTITGLKEPSGAQLSFRLTDQSFAPHDLRGGKFMLATREFVCVSSWKDLTWVD